MALDRRTLLVAATIALITGIPGLVYAAVHIQHFKYVQTIVIPVNHRGLTGIRLSYDLIEHTSDLHDVRIVRADGNNVPLAAVNDSRIQTSEETYLRAEINKDTVHNTTVIIIDRRVNVLEHTSIEIPLIETAYTGTVTVETSADNNHWTRRSQKQVTGVTGRTLQIDYEPTADRFVRVIMSGTDILASKLIGITSYTKYLLFEAEPKQSYKLYYGSAFAGTSGQKKLSLTETDLRSFFSADLESKIGLRSDNPAYKDINKEASAAIATAHNQFPYAEPILYILGSIGVLYVVYKVMVNVEGSTKK